MITRSYDVLVCGMRPGGLLAAALCAKRGMRVLVIDDAQLEPSRQGPYSFPSHAYPFMGLDDPLLLASALDELTIHPTARKAIARCQPSFQVVMPRHRVDVSPDPERFAAEISREFHEAWEPIEALLEALKEAAGEFALAWQTRRTWLPRPSLLQRVGMGSGSSRPLFNSSPPTLGELLDGSEVSDLFKIFLLAQVAAFGYHFQPERVPLPAAAHLLMSARGGLFDDSISPHPMQNLLLTRLADLRGDVYPDIRCTGLNFSWGKVTSATVSDHPTPIDCEFLVWGASYERLLSVIPEGQHKRYSARLSAMPPAGRRFSLQLVMGEEGIPEGMATHVVAVKDPFEPLVAGNLLYVSTSPVGVERFCPSGMRTVTLSTPLPDDHPLAADPETLAEVMLSHLREFIPFLDLHVREQFIDTSPECLSASLWDSSVVSEQHVRDLGPGPRLPHWNIFQCGRDSFPLLGFEGEIGAGVLSVDGVVAATSK